MSLHNLYLDSFKNLGEEKRFISVKPWIESKELLGAKILVLLPQREFDRIEVKVSLSVEQVRATGIKHLDSIEFENLEGKTYDVRGNKGIKWTAEDVQKINEGG